MQWCKNNGALELGCREIERGVCICLSENFSTLASEEEGLSYRRTKVQASLGSLEQRAKLLKES